MNTPRTQQHPDTLTIDFCKREGRKSQERRKQGLPPIMKKIGGESSSDRGSSDTPRDDSDNEAGGNNKRNGERDYDHITEEGDNGGRPSQEIDTAGDDTSAKDGGNEEIKTANDAGTATQSTSHTADTNKPTKRKDLRISLGESGRCADMSSSLDDNTGMDQSVVIEDCSMSDKVDDAIAMLSCIGAAVTLDRHDSLRAFANSFKPSLPGHMRNDVDSVHMIRAPLQNSRIDLTLLRTNIEAMHSLVHDIFSVVSRREFDNSRIARDNAFKDLTDTVQHDHQPPLPSRPERRNTKRIRRY